MAETIGQHQISAFTSPVNGDPLDANVSRGNDNTIRNAYVDHDADPGIHVQSSALAARPSANSLGRKWMSVDGSAVRLFYDTGTTWSELTAQAGTLLGSTLASGVTASSLTSVGTLSSLTVSGDLTVDTSTLKVDSANNAVGIGTTTPSTFASGTLTVSKNTASGDTALSLRNGAAPATGGVQGTIINFLNDSGSTTALAYIQSRSNDGGTAGETSLRFGTYNGSTLAERMRIDAGGSLGLSVTPSAWPTASYAVLELPIGGHIITDKNGNNLELGANFYINSSFQAIYKANGAAASYNQDSGVHKWSTAPSGTAGNVATLTERMLIKANGQVRFVPLAADPSGAEAGDVYYNSSSNKLKVYNGTSWVDLH